MFDVLCPIAPWALHNLRRTFATGLAELSVAPHVIERLLNHAGGTISGVAAIYNRFKYQDEMREAIKLWEARLHGLITLRRAA
jgi:integrase